MPVSVRVSEATLNQRFGPRQTVVCHTKNGTQLMTMTQQFNHLLASLGSFKEEEQPLEASV